MDAETIAKALTSIVGCKPKSQKIAWGIQSLCHEDAFMQETGKMQLQAGIKEDKYPITEEHLYIVFKDVCGLKPEVAKKRAAFALSK